MADRFEAAVGDLSPALGKAVSEAARDARDGREDSTLVYGEIRFDTFQTIFDKMRGLGALAEPGGVFYDLGSGLGKPCLAAALLHRFDRVVGFELLPELHEQSLLLAARAAEQGIEPPLEFVCADFCLPAAGWADDATVVYANSTCFSWAMLDAIAGEAERLAPGALVVTGTKGLRSPCFDELVREIMLTSWGRATVVIQRRNEEPPPENPPPPGERRGWERPPPPPPPPFDIPVLMHPS